MEIKRELRIRISCVSMAVAHFDEKIQLSIDPCDIHHVDSYGKFSSNMKQRLIVVKCQKLICFVCEISLSSRKRLLLSVGGECNSSFS